MVHARLVIRHIVVCTLLRCEKVNVKRCLDLLLRKYFLWRVGCSVWMERMRSGLGAITGLDGVANFRRWGISLGGMDCSVCKHARSLGPSCQ